jgi:hypothetical protein
LSLESLLTVTESIEKNALKHIEGIPNAAGDDLKSSALPVAVNGVTLKGSGHLAGKTALPQDEHREDVAKNVNIFKIVCC